MLQECKLEVTGGVPACSFAPQVFVDGSSLISPPLQDRKLEQKGRDWRGAYMMPTQMDRAVTAFRRWLSEHAGPLQYDPRSSRAAVQQELSREQLLDRYNQHVKHCTVCSTVSTRDSNLQRGWDACQVVTAVPGI